MTQKRLASTGLADETDVLAVGLGRGAKPECSRALAHLRLGQMADGKQRVGELALVEHVHHVALVFGRVGTARHTPHARRLALDARMVTGRDGVEAEQARAL